VPVPFAAELVADLDRLRAPGRPPLFDDPEHVVACLFQTVRAFVNVYTHLVGSSAPMARLRADVWRSIFSRDAALYYRGLYARMPDVTTLVLGPTGTGKELVARAIAHSGYVPFDAKARRFPSPPGTPFLAINLSALSSTLIEAELFGHQRGSFTGATADRRGFLEACAAGGVIFLDEIGDLDAALQIKLLRVLQDRTFQRIGDTKARRFVGKVVAATNRDLVAEMKAGRFRADFYYRLCGDIIATPSLAAQLTDSPRDLPHLVRFIAERVATPELAPDLATDVMAFIEGNLPTDYAWPGNFRELEQCVRNVMVRGRYQPQEQPARALADELADAVRDTTLSADELFGRYAALVVHRSGSLREAARRLGTDARTVKARLDAAFLKRLRAPT
jgi:transcriptional regulator with GAF, ATPase, and Fis domain